MFIWAFTPTEQKEILDCLGPDFALESEDEWYSLSPSRDLNVYLDKNGKVGYTIYKVIDGIIVTQ